MTPNLLHRARKNRLAAVQSLSEPSTDNIFRVDFNAAGQNEEDIRRKPTQRPLPTLILTSPENRVAA